MIGKTILHFKILKKLDEGESLHYSKEKMKDKR